MAYRSRREKNSKKIVFLLCLLACLILVALVAVFGYQNSNAKVTDVAYVDTVANWTSTGKEGTVNRFSGVALSEDTWSVPAGDIAVKEFLVNTGDQVEAGTPLFTYDVQKIQEELDQAKIDLDRLNNEISSLDATIQQLEYEKSSASAEDQGNYTIQIQEQELQKQQKQLDLQSKQAEIDKMNSTVSNATVTSQIDGTVQYINTAAVSGSGSGENSGTASQTSGTSADPIITVVKSGELKVKGNVNEQNVGEIVLDMPVIVYSRVDDKTWTGKVESIDSGSQSGTGDAEASGESAEGSSGEDSSASYPFYVVLDSSDGLMAGQHVYIEKDVGQNREKKGIWLPDYLIDQTDESYPFVWASHNGKLTKHGVTLGRHDDDLGEYLIKDGLELSDSIAVPDDYLKSGMKTAPMSEKPAGTKVNSAGNSSSSASVTPSAAAEGAKGSSGSGSGNAAASSQADSSGDSSQAGASGGTGQDRAGSIESYTGE